MELNKKKNVKLLAVIVSTLLLLSISFFLVYQYWSPLGKKLKINFVGKDGKIIPAQTQNQNGNFAIPAQIIQSAVTRFTMDVKSGEIESVTAKLKFKTGPKEIKLGIRGSEKDKFVYQSFYQNLLQNCAWDKIEETGNFLYQKVRNYNNINQLIDNPPDYQQIAIYNIQPSVLLQKLLTNGLNQKNPTLIDIKTGLRGTHTFEVRVDKAPFYFKLAKQDLNMYTGEDKYLISISRNGQLIEEKSIPDDGFVGTELLKKDPQSVEFNLTDIEPGIYEISAKYQGSGNDSVITQIETNQSQIVIKNNVFTLYSQPITFYTYDSPLTLQTFHKDYIQTVNLNDTIPLEIKKEAEKYVFDLKTLVKNPRPDGFYKLETPKTDVIFSSTGYFAFAPEQYFDPEVIHATDLNTVGSLDEIDYLLTSVPKATQEGDWLVSTATFDPKDITLDENKKLYFSLEMPDLAKYSGELEIDSFTVEVKTKGALSDILGKKITNTPAPINTPYPTAIPTIRPSPQPSPTATVGTPITSINKDVNIRVLNAGAPVGYATKYAGLIKAAGYISVTAANGPDQNLKNATVLFPEKFKTDAQTIENILKAEYKIVDGAINYTSSDIIINLGAT